MAKRRLTKTEERLLLAEFEREAERPRPKTRRKLRSKPKAGRRRKRKIAPKNERIRERTKIHSEKFNQDYIAKEVRTKLGKPIIVRHDSDTFKIANKIFAVIKNAVRFKQNQTRKIALRFGFRSKYKRVTRYFSTLVEDCESQSDLYDLCVRAVDDLKFSLVKYVLRNQNVRITEINLVEYH